LNLPEKRLKNELESELSEYYSSVNILRHNSIKLESLVQEVMIEKLRGHKIEVP